MINKKSKIAALLCPALIAVCITGCASASHQESTGEYIDSSAITTKVKAKLLADKNLRTLPITVRTYKNSVQLSGFVHTRAQKQRAEDLARSVEGVEMVDDVIAVK